MCLTVYLPLYSKGRSEEKTRQKKKVDGQRAQCNKRMYILQDWEKQTLSNISECYYKKHIMKTSRKSIVSQAYISSLQSQGTGCGRNNYTILQAACSRGRGRVDMWVCCLRIAVYTCLFHCNPWFGEWWNFVVEQLIQNGEFPINIQLLAFLFRFTLKRP